jgi:hypothetical protein
MPTITRKSALTVFSIYKVAGLSRAEIEDLLFAHYLDAESGDPIAYRDIHDDDVQDFLVTLHVEVVFRGVSNDWLQSFLARHFNREFSISGAAPELEKCPCCGYLTLPRRGEYDVCPVCLWEDDGKSEDRLDSFSTVNGSSLKNYRLSRLNNLLQERSYYRKG